MTPSLCVLLLAFLSLQDDPAALIEKLRSDNVEVREAASKKLKELGKAAKPALEKAAKDPDEEVAKRAAHLLRILQLKDELTPTLQKAMPDAVERLAQTGDANWTAVLLEAAARDRDGNRKHQELFRDDLMPLVKRAFQGADKDADKSGLCYVALSWRMKQALPEVEKFLTDPNSQVRLYAVMAYGEIGGRAVVGRLAEFLKDTDGQIRMSAAERLRLCGSKSQAKALVEALKDDNAWVRMQALSALGELGDRSVIADVKPLLNDKPAAGFAAYCLARLGAVESVPQIVTALAIPDARPMAMHALSVLDARDSAKEISAHLGDEKAETRAAAASILALWGDPEAKAQLAELLTESDKTARDRAVAAVGRLRDPNLTKQLPALLKADFAPLRAHTAGELARLDAFDSMSDIAAVMKDKDSYPRWNSTLAIGTLASRLPEVDRKPWIEALKSAESDPVEDVRYAASVSLVRLGAKDLAQQREIARKLEATSFHFRWIMVAELPLALAQIHEIGGYQKLMRPQAMNRTVDSTEALAAVFEDAGVKLANPADIVVKGRKIKGTVISPFDLLYGMVESWPGVIVEKDSIRVVPHEEALEYWIRRLAAK